MEKRVVPVSHPIVQKKIKRALRESLFEGIFSACQIGLGVSYLMAFALAFGASGAQIALLTSMIMLIPAVVQIRSSNLIERYSRKKITLFFAWLELGGYLLLIISAILFLRGYNIGAIIVSACILLIYILSAPSHVAWFSWMGSLVPENERGKYFGKRNRYVQIFSLMSLILGGFILDHFKTEGFVILGFVIIFSLAFIFRSIALLILSTQYEPKIFISKRDELNLISFLKELKHTPFGRFSIYTMILRTLIYFGAPFLIVYMLSIKNFSYIEFMVVSVALSSSMAFFYPFAGKIADIFGNIKLLRLSTIALAISYSSWIFSTNLYYLIFFTQLFAGFAWAGILLASNNYIYDVISQKKRSFALANFNFLIGIGMSIGSGLGALFALLSFRFINTPLFIIGLSGLLIFIFYIFSEGLLREVRHVKHFRYQWLMREVGAGVITRELHALNNVSSKVVHIIKVKE